MTSIVVEQSCRVHRLKQLWGVGSVVVVCVCSRALAPYSSLKGPVAHGPRAGAKPVSPELAGKLLTTSEIPTYGDLV